MGYNTGFSGSLTIEPPLSAKDRDFINQAARADMPPDMPGCPSSYLQWVIDEDGSALRWDGNEKFYDYEEWLEYLLDVYLGPWGHKVNGALAWQGDDSDDRGVIYVRDNVIESVADRVNNPGPHWEAKAADFLVAWIAPDNTRHWEIISGEDAAQERVSGLCDQGIRENEIVLATVMAD